MQNYITCVNCYVVYNRSVTTSTSPSAEGSTCSADNQPPAKRRKSSKGDDVDLAILNTLKDIGEISKKQENTDDDELFGCHVAAVLRRLNNWQKATARLRIEQTLLDVEFPQEDIHYTQL